MSGIEFKPAFRRIDFLRRVIRRIVAILDVALTVEVGGRVDPVPDRIILAENLPGKPGVRIARIQSSTSDVAPAGPALLDLRIHRHLIPSDRRCHPRVLLQNQIQSCGRSQIAQRIRTIVSAFAAEKLLELRSCLRQSDFPAGIRVGNAPETIQNAAFRDPGGEKRLCPELRFKVAGNLK